MNNSTNRPVGLLIVGLSLNLGASSAMNLQEEPKAETKATTSVPEQSERAVLNRGWDKEDQSGTASDPKDSPPVKPPREARARGFRIALLVGIDVSALARYAYDTRVSLHGGDQLQYRGWQRSPGVALFAGGAATLPGALRRITLGAGINAGGLDSKDRSVIPAGVSTPFSKKSLQADIQRRYVNRLGWHSAFSPYIEHDLGFFLGGRVRAGYQHWEQIGSHIGSFAPIDGSRESADYNIRLNFRSHLVRVSVNEYFALDLDDDTNTSHRSKRKSGMIQQWGVLIGTHQTIMVFAAIGPFWEIAR